MKRKQWYISTVDRDAQDYAREHGLGLEIAEYCSAYNMDDYFDQVHPSVADKLNGISSRVLHAPFNELFPCAIDPKARELARFRYRQAMKLAVEYGAEKIVIHAGYNPRLYYPVWYTAQTADFWKDFAYEIPEGLTVCLENVFEEEIDMFLDIFKELDDPRIRICLDIGHVNTYSDAPVEEWVRQCAPYISHFHIHNNDRDADTHQNFHEGTIDMKHLLELADELCPAATYTIEVVESEASVKWLAESGLIEGE